MKNRNSGGKIGAGKKQSLTGVKKTDILLRKYYRTVIRDGRLETYVTVVAEEKGR
jgi:hypothetical protein